MPDKISWISGRGANYCDTEKKIETSHVRHCQTVKFISMRLSNGKIFIIATVEKNSRAK